MQERFALKGYAFDTKAEWEEAKREEEAIGYIKAKTNLSDPAAALQLYLGLAEKKTFITPIGIDFLWELKKGLLSAGAATEEELPGIPVRISPKKSPRTEELSRDAENKNKQLADYYKDKWKNSRIVILVLAVVVAAMFGITMLGPNSPMIDAEVKVQDKYAAWAQQLTERENAVEQRERELGIAPAPSEGLETDGAAE